MAESAVKRIGVLTSGGDAPGMNAAVRSVVRSALDRGIECIGIRRGWSGLVNGDFYRMDSGSVSRIINRGGTILYTARSEEFRTAEGQAKAAGVCKLLGLDGIVAIGGDGTFRGAQELSKCGVSVVGIPGTIDNDIVCTDYSIGFDTAANTAWNASISCGTPCSPTSAVPWWRSWAAMPAIWPCMWAWPWVPRQCWCRSTPMISRSRWPTISAMPDSMARPTL